jgi:hypothetical protein
MKTFNLTATITVEAESQEELEKIMAGNGSDEQREMIYDLWNSVEIDEEVN